MNVTKRIKLDFARSLNPVVVWVKQGDENSRFIEIVPLKNGDNYTIPSGVSIKFACKKPDGHQVLNDYPTISNNIITVPLSPQTLAAAGEGLASIILFDDENQKILSTQNFILYIEQNPLVGSEVESSDEYQSYLAALLRIDELPEITEEDEGKVLGVKDGEFAFVDGDDGSAEIVGENYVTAYGAKGDGVTDDTAAFKSAMESERVVFVPGGTYKLSEGITIGDNCCLELSQDTVLDFTNTEGNCITLGMISHLKGNHATVKVPYEFSGKVVYAYSNDHLEAEAEAVPPWSKWDPMWKSGRYVTDLNICKADSRGFHYAVEPSDCKGTAVYLSADNTVGKLGYMWGINVSGLRIAGAFSYGIHAINIDGGWTNDMRIDAIIDACEVGVQLENCGQAYISAIVQPRQSYSIDEVYKRYAKHGIKLVNSKNVDLSGSRVWDWDAERTLWTDGGEYQHIAMLGDCSGAILSDFRYHNAGYDTRKNIYTDRSSNLDSLTILQEPVTKYYFLKNGSPYYTDGVFDYKLITQEHLDEHFTTDIVKGFTDLLPTAIDQDGSIYNGIGYKTNVETLADGGELVNSYYVSTGFIPCKKGDKLYAEQLSFSGGWDSSRIVLYDVSFNKLVHVNRSILLNGGNYFVKHESLTNGFVCTIEDVPEIGEVAFARLSIHKSSWGDNPMIAVNEEIRYTVEGFLADSVKVKGENVIGNVGEVQPDWIATKTINEGAPVWTERNVTFENSLAFCSQNGGNFKADTGVEYDVYWNGTLYRCEAKMYDEAVYIGNGSLVYNDSVENTGEPFCFYGVFVAPDTVAYIKKDTDTAETVKIKVTLKGSVEYNKLPKEYLPDDIGGSIDVTAEVGQTIRVTAVDENGKPTAWESAEYQPRMFWSEEGIGTLVPNTVFHPIFNAQFQMFQYLLPEFGFEAGKSYTVIYDGVEYTGTAVAGTFSGLDVVTVGNTYLTTGVMTNEPFVVAKIPALGAMAVVCLTSQDTSEIHSIQINGEKTIYHTPAPEYAPNEYWVSFLETGVVDEEGRLIYQFSADWDELTAAIKARKNVYASLAFLRNNGSFCRHIYMLGFAEIGFTPIEGYEYTDRLMFGICHNNVNETIGITVRVYRWSDGTVTVSNDIVNVQPT